MMALLHFLPSGPLVGVWIDREDTDHLPQRFYVDPGYEDNAKGSLMVKGIRPTWSDWFRQLADRAPYGAWFETLVVPENSTAAQVFAQASAYNDKLGIPE